MSVFYSSKIRFLKGKRFNKGVTLHFFAPAAHEKFSKICLIINSHSGGFWMSAIDLCFVADLAGRGVNDFVLS